MSDRDIGVLVEGWAPPPRPGRDVLSGRYVRLEPLTVDHADDLYSAFAGADEIWDYMYIGSFASAAEYADWIRANALGDDPVFFALHDLASNRALGVASYLRISLEAGSIELGNIVLSLALQKSRAATEAWYLMMRWAFEAGYRRFEWKCNAQNLPSRRAAERLGLSFEGVFRQAAVVKGRNRDTAWFAAIDGEWPNLRAAFEAWLDPSNFDESGQQRTSLSALTHSILVSRDPAVSGYANR